MSNSLETILVALDGSEPSQRALDFAITLAQSSGARLELVTILDLAHLDPEAGFYLTEAELEKLRQKLGGDILDPAREKVPPEVTCETTLLEGRVVERMLSYIDDKKPSMVVLGRTGKTAFQRLLEGSVSRGIVTHASSPVTVVG